MEQIKKINIETEKEEITKLVQDAKINKAIEKLGSVANDEVIQTEINFLLYKLKKLNKDFFSGVIMTEYNSTESNKIVKEFLSLVDTVFEQNSKIENKRSILKKKINAIDYQIVEIQSINLKKNLGIIILIVLFLLIVGNLAFYNIPSLKNFFKYLFPVKFPRIGDFIFLNKPTFDGGLIVFVTFLLMLILSNKQVNRIIQLIVRLIKEKLNINFIIFFFIPVAIFCYTTNYIGIASVFLILGLNELRKKTSIIKSKISFSNKIGKALSLILKVGILGFYLLIFFQGNKLIFHKKAFTVLDLPTNLKISYQDGIGKQLFQEFKAILNEIEKSSHNVKFFPENYHNYGSLIENQNEKNIISFINNYDKGINYCFRSEFNMVESDSKVSLRIIGFYEALNHKELVSKNYYSEEVTYYKYEVKTAILHVLKDFFKFCFEKEIVKIEHQNEIYECILRQFIYQLENIDDDRKDKAESLKKKIIKKLNSDGSNINSEVLDSFFLSYPLTKLKSETHK